VECLLKRSLLAAIGPGILITATGVGAGDIATAGFSGAKLGVVILWAASIGAFVKFCLNEGLTRYQLATGDTLLEGALRRFGRPAQALFLLYFLPWSFFVGSALIGGCGVAGHALIPIFDNAQHGKIFWGLTHSALGAWLALRGGYKLFEKVMAVAIGVMFITVTATAILLRPDWAAIAQGLVLPRIPEGGITWTVALMGGVGGTLTVLCYGYWIREEGRTTLADLPGCRLDLAVGYTVTALFSIAMVIVGSRSEISGRGTGLIVALAQSLEGPLGPGGRWVFLVGAWAAIASSLLGVWQSVPYLFADFVSICRGDDEAGQQAARSTGSALYRGYVLVLASVPALGLALSFREAQKLYGIIGAGFLPLLAITLLILNSSGKQRNQPATVAVLIGTVLFFLFAAYLKFR
jgi:Mn2+/Fe2+ NRAMP family transporter